MLSVPSPFQRPREAIKQADEARAKFEDPTSDHVTLLNLWTEWRRRGENSQWAYENFVHARSLKTADSIRSQLSRMIGARGGGGARRGRGGAGSGRADGAVGCSVRRCLLAGHFMQSAHLCKGGKVGGATRAATTPAAVAVAPPCVAVVVASRHPRGRVRRFTRRRARTSSSRSIPPRRCALRAPIGSSTTRCSSRRRPSCARPRRSRQSGSSSSRRAISASRHPPPRMAAPRCRRCRKARRGARSRRPSRRGDAPGRREPVAGST